MRRHRILFLNHVARVGGAERSLLDLVGHLDRNRFDLLAAAPGEGELPDLLADLGVTCHPLPFKRLRKTFNPVRLAGELAGVLRVAGELVSLIRREGVSLVHANSNTAQLYGGLAARRAGVPCVWHTRDLVNLGPMGRWLGRHASCTIAISECVRRHASRYVADPARLRTVTNGIALDVFTPRSRRAEVRAELGIPADVPLLGMIGQLAPWKGHGIFIEAAARVAAEIPACRFVLVGEDLFQDRPGCRAALEAQAAAAGLGGRLLFLGFGQDVARLLEGLDILLHPPDREPLGRIILEAMAMGKPVVAVNACGPGEIIRDGVDGLLAARSDPAELAAAALRLLRDPALAARIGRTARQRIEQDFSIRRTAAGIEEVYDELLDAEGRMPCA
jgi:glycosyltransferase involved in cell wall biosynthesis